MPPTHDTEHAGAGATRQYLAYCKFHGHEGDPAGMLKADAHRRPVNRMSRYVQWLSKNLAAFKRAHGLHDDLAHVNYCLLHPGAFEEWLETRAIPHNA